MGFFAKVPLSVTVANGTFTSDWIPTLGSQELLGDIRALGGEEGSPGQLRRCSFPIQRGLTRSPFSRLGSGKLGSPEQTEESG